MGSEFHEGLKYMVREECMVYRTEVLGCAYYNARILLSSSSVGHHYPSSHVPLFPFYSRP